MKNGLEQLKQNNSELKTEVLYLACIKGSAAITTLLAAEYHSVFDWKVKWSNFYPLLEAARRKHTFLFEILLQYKSFKDYKDAFASMRDGEGCSLLHIAADVQDDVIIQFSLKCGVDPTSKNDKGMTALHYVALRGNLNACKLLLESFGDKHGRILSYIESEADNICNETAVYFAAKYNHKRTLKFLLQR